MKTLFFISSLAFISHGAGRSCWSRSGKPNVTQIDSASVEISWEGLLNNKACADTFRVRFEPVKSSKEYRISGEINKRDNSTIVTGLESSKEYNFQVRFKLFFF